MSDNQKLGAVLTGVGVLVVIALVVFLVAGGDDGGDGSGDEEAGGEVFLEPVASEGEDPFTDSVSNPDNAQPDIEPAEGDEDDDSTLTVTSSDGAEPGLYGGTRDQSSCDRRQLVAFLEDNPDKASAWAEVLGISPSEIGDYVEGLTPVQLRADTRVTNHGFRNGRPTPRQSVLQAGTAVLVDEYGVPRVRCACGNPLLEPVPVQRAPRYTGPRWPAYTPTQIDVVTMVTVINVITIVDIDTGEEFDRPVGTDGSEDTDVGSDGDDVVIDDNLQDSLGTGDVQVTLSWTGPADVDLRVTGPDNTEIYYGNRESPTGGMLDADDIPECSETGTHVENVFWPEGGAPSGSYSAFARNLGGCDTGSTSFTLTVRVGGQVVDQISGSLGPSEDSQTVTFSHS